MEICVCPDWSESTDPIWLGIYAPQKLEAKSISALVMIISG